MATARVRPVPIPEFASASRSPTGSATPNRVRIGGVSKAELLSQLAGARVRLNPMAEELLADPRFTTRPESSFVEVVAVSVASFGFHNGATFAQLAARAAGQGLSLRPLELAPHLRLQFTEQPEGSVGRQTQHRAPPGSLTVASPPPSDEQDIPWGFYLRRIEGDLWLRGYRSWPGHQWAPDDHLVFTRAPNAA